MSPPPYSAKVPLLKGTLDRGTHLKDTLNLIPGLSLSPALSKIEVSYLYIGQTFKERLLVRVLETGRALSGPRCRWSCRCVSRKFRNAVSGARADRQV